MSLFTKKQSDIPRRRQSTLPHAVRQAATPGEGNIFRRNRTLTGTTSNHLAATRSKNDLESPRTHAHNLAMYRRRVAGVLLMVLLGAAVVLLLLSQLTAQPVVSVSDTAISRPVDTSKYEKAIQNYLEMNPFSRLRFILDQTALNAYIQQQLPEVAHVTQRGFIGVGKTDFELTMRAPVAGWKIGANQYYVDANGVPFQQNYFATPAVQIIDNSGVTVEQGTAIASNRFLGFVGRVVALSGQAGYAVSQAIIPSGTTRQLEVRLKDSNFLVKLSIDRPAGEQVEDMGRAVKYLISRGQSPQYIDVRVSGKAFYQ